MKPLEVEGFGLSGREDSNLYALFPLVFYSFGLIMLHTHGGLLRPHQFKNVAIIFGGSQISFILIGYWPTF